MVISLLVIPAAFAHLTTSKIKRFLLIAVVFGVLNCIIGYYISVFLNINIVATINCLMGVLIISTLAAKQFKPKVETS